MKRRFLLNVMASLASQVVSWVLSVVVTWYVPNYLGANRFAALEGAGAVIAMLAPYTVLGLNTLVIREVARDPKEARALVHCALQIRLLLCCGAIMVGLLLSRLYDPPVRAVLYVSLLALPLLVVIETVNCVLRGKEEIVLSNSVGIADRVVSTLLQIAAVRAVQPLLAFATIPVVSTLTTSVPLLVRESRYFFPLRRFRMDEARKYLILGFPFFVGIILFSIWEPGNKLILLKIAGASAVAWYGLTKRLVGSVMFLPVALSSVVMPSLTRQFYQQPEQFERNTLRILRLIVLIAVPAAVVLIFASGTLIETLYPNPRFHGAILPLRLMGPAVVLWYLSQIVAPVIIASGRQHAFSRVTLTAAVFCVPLCLSCIWLAHRFLRNGAVGACVADILIEIFMLSRYIKIMPVAFPTRDMVSLLARSSICALPAALLMNQIHSKSDLWLILPGCLSYVLLCFPLKCVGADDLQLMKDAFAETFRRRSAG